MSIPSSSPSSSTSYESSRHVLSSTFQSHCIELWGGAFSTTLPTTYVDLSTIRQIPDNQEAYLDPHQNISIIFELVEQVDEETNNLKTIHDVAFYYFDDLANLNEEIDKISNENISSSSIVKNMKTLSLNQESEKDNEKELYSNKKKPMDKKKKLNNDDENNRLESKAKDNENCCIIINGPLSICTSLSEYSQYILMGKVSSYKFGKEEDHQDIYLYLALIRLPGVGTDLLISMNVPITSLTTNTLENIGITHASSTSSSSSSSRSKSNLDKKNIRRQEINEFKRLREKYNVDIFQNPDLISEEDGHKKIFRNLNIFQRALQELKVNDWNLFG